MGMSNAERQRKFRQNRDNNPTKRKDYLNKEKERYQKNKQLGKRKCVAAMTKREHRAAKKKWRNEKRKTTSNKKLTEDKMETPAKAPSAPVQTSRQKAQSLKKKTKDMAQCYRDNAALKTQLDIEKRKAEMYRKRWVRASDKTKLDSSIVDTPRTKTRKLLRNCSKKYVRKTLIFHNAMIDQIKENYGNTQKKGVKRTLSSLLSGSVLRKYKVKTIAFQQCGIDIRNNLKKKNNLSTRLCKPVREFYNRDDVSRITTGMKRTITFKKIKKQRRILNDTLFNLHLKFLSESKMTVSYSTFCRLRPFWVVFPNQSDRNTCLCKLCENSQFMCDALKKSTAIETDNLNKMIERMVCDTKYMACMFSDCDKCKHNRITFNNELQDDEVQWSEWTLRNEKRLIKVGKKNEEKTITLTVKETKEGTIFDLVDKFEEQLRRYQKHVFLIKNQYSYYRTKKQSLADDECMIHIDFSENYVCKMASEIQSMHFGASKKQISLHTGIYITKHQQQSFCTVSENLNHGPAAIWSHLDPVLKCLKKEHPKIDTIEFFSDGPTTQYRQKGNFYLASIKPKQYGFKNIIWNFLEAGHGKGVPDAIGGALKRTADQQIKYGKDIMTAQQFVNNMKKSETKCFLITERNIVDEQTKLEGVELKAIPGTMKLHQMMFLDKIYFRDLSCTCKVDNVCTDHKLNCSEVRKDWSCSTKLTNKSRKKTANQPIEKPAPIEKSDNDRIGTAPTQASSIATNKTDFSKLIRDLNACKSFKQLTALCKTISKSLECFKAVSKDVSIMTHSLDVDANAMDSYPNDVPDSRALYPCVVPADGNCLPSCGSIYAFGSLDHADEIRVRIVTELVCHEDWYLNADCLRKGTTLPSTNLPKIYAGYSDMFIPGVVLTENMIRNIYELEALKIRQDKAYMGIWQIHALASILKVPIYSVYPKMGNPNVRLDLNRLVLPREPLPTTDKSPVYIHWTSNRHKQMTHEHWVPNHFVVVVPIDHSTGSNIVVNETASDLDLSNECEEGVAMTEAVVEDQDTEIKLEVEQNQEDGEGQECVEMDKKEQTQEAGQEQGRVEMKNGKEESIITKEVVEGQEYVEMNKKSTINEERDEGQEGVEMDMTGENQNQVEGEGQECMSMSAGESQKRKIDDVHEGNEMTKKEGTNVKQEMVEGHKSMEIDRKVMLDMSEELGCMEVDQKEVGDQGKNLSEKSEIREKKNGGDQRQEDEGYDVSGDSESKENEWKNIPDPDKCVGLYVIVSYNNSAYPGLVVDAGQSDLYVECMHRLGKKGTNCFYWPKKLKDVCWYDYDNVLAVIPEPSKIESSYSHFKLDDEIWKSVQN